MRPNGLVALGPWRVAGSTPLPSLMPPVLQWLPWNAAHSIQLPQTRVIGDTFTSERNRHTHRVLGGRQESLIVLLVP